MGVTYKKLWIMLIERNISKPQFREMVDVSPATITKLNRNRYVQMEILEKVCRTLNCSFDDIVELLPESEKKTEIEEVTGDAH
jgi:DNA-binding Xre family transcriptional regulator